MPLRVISIGEVLVDFVAPQADDLIGANQFVRAAGGAPANVAVAAARLGCKSGLVALVGNDPFGQYLRGVLERNGVDTSAVRVVPQRTTLAFVAKNAGGIPDFVFYRGADALLSASDIPPTVRQAGFVHVSSMALLTEPSAEANWAAVEQGAAGNALISVDPNLRPSSWPSPAVMVETVRPLVAAADVLKVNEDEARLLSGEEDLHRAVAQLGKPEGLAIITLGAAGALWRWRDRIGLVAAPRVTVVETTGAGDAFVGAILAELLRLGFTKQNFQQLDTGTVKSIVRFANVAGALACTQPGAMASLPTREDMMRFMEQGDERTVS